MVVPRLEPASGDDINPDPQEFLKILEQASLVNKRRTWLEVDEQVHITADLRLSPGDRAEDRDPARPTLARDPQYLGPAPAERFDGQDVVAHLRSVSPCAFQCLHPRRLDLVPASGLHALCLALIGGRLAGALRRLSARFEPGSLHPSLPRFLTRVRRG